MAIKERINQALRVTTGYQLTRNPEAVRRQLHAEMEQTPDQLRQRVERLRSRLEVSRERNRELRREVNRLTRNLEKIRRRGNPTKGHIPSYIDDAAREIILRAKPRTLTGVEKLLPMVDALRYVADNDIPGAIVECGVWRGGSMQAMAWTLMDAGVTDRDLYLYDTFEGMSEPGEFDVQTRTRANAADLLAAGKARCLADYDDVHAGMVETGYPMEKIHLYKGKVEETIPAHMPKEIAVLRLDTDWYESTRHELEHLYPLLVPGGVLIIDDFGSWDGARKAVLEWLAETKEPLLLVPIGAARIAIKRA